MTVSSLKNLEQIYPAISDLKKLAKKRLPKFSRAYLETGTGDEQSLYRNRKQMNNVIFIPRFLKGDFKPEISTELFGQMYAAPFGIAPVGLAGLIWPHTDQILARTAKKYKIPFCLSTVGNESPETIGPIAGDMGWFQLYSPRYKEIRDDLMERIRVAGFKTLVVTADVPIPSRRERVLRAGIRMPSTITPNLFLQALFHPKWAISTLRAGLPVFKTLVKYAKTTDISKLGEFVGQNIGGTLSWEYLKEVRDQWHGPLVLKGILHPGDVEEAIKLGVDGIVVSNHGARQFDGAPASIEVLPLIVDQFKGEISILFDGGVSSGLDILRAIALGADFVFLGRGFIYGVAALGEIGGEHVANILINDLTNNMTQLGVMNLEEAKQSKSVSCMEDSLRHLH